MNIGPADPLEFTPSSRLSEEHIETILGQLRKLLSTSVETTVTVESDVRDVRWEVVAARGGNPMVRQVASIGVSVTIKTATPDQIQARNDVGGPRLGVPMR